MVHVGTSGFSYPEWRGTFYPERFPPGRMLPYYAQRFHTVELNNTFYRMPTGKTIAGWDQDAPAGFVFALKVPQRITHFARLRDVAEPFRYLLDTVGPLGPKLGPLLLQLPPNFRKDTGRLGDCLALVPPSVRMAVEFRHASWLDDEVYGILRARNAALCLRITYTTKADGTRKASLPEESYAYVMDFIRETSQKSPAGIAAAVQAGHDAMMRNLEGLTDDQACSKPAPDQWSVLEVMAHLVTVKRIMATLCTHLGKGELPPGFGPQFEEERAQDGVTAARFSTLAEAREASEAAHHDLLTFIAGVDGADTSLTFGHFFFGAMNARQWACFQYVHDGDHGPQILKIRNTPGFPA